MLDEFEGDEYYKQPVQAQLGAGGAVETVVYVWQDALRGYMYGEWDPEAFRCGRGGGHDAAPAAAPAAGCLRCACAHAPAAAGARFDAAFIPSRPPRTGRRSCLGTWRCAGALRRTSRRRAAGKATSRRPPMRRRAAQRQRKRDSSPEPLISIYRFIGGLLTGFIRRMTDALAGR